MRYIDLGPIFCNFGEVWYHLSHTQMKEDNVFFIIREM